MLGLGWAGSAQLIALMCFSLSLYEINFFSRTLVTKLKYLSLASSCFTQYLRHNVERLKCCPLHLLAEEVLILMGRRQ